MSKEHEDWMTPLNKILWMQAFKRRAESVTLRDGRKFKIKYGYSITYPASGEKRELVHVMPADGKTLVPRGYLDLKEVTHKEWIAETGEKAKVVQPPNVETE